MSPTFDFASPYDFVYRSGRHEARLNPAPSAFEGGMSAPVFNPAPLFCDRHVCRLTDGPDFLFFDGGHFSVAGSRRVARSLTPYLSQVMAGRSVVDPL
jgi:lysophospholipase L1-like esterase